MADNYLMVCAIDFGTTYSGYAFSFTASPEEIKMNKNWGSSSGFQSYKAPTSVLVDNHGALQYFGFDAEEEYNQAIEKSESKHLSLYRQFKMILHKQKNVSKNTTVKSVEGKTVTALDVFSHALKYLKDHLLKQMTEAFTKPEDRDIRWVLTVPAIWTDGSKHFMRMAAHKAGLIPFLDSPQLVIALEPEAASLYCRRLNIVSFIGDVTVDGFPEGTKYLVIDAGGGTVDISAHQIIKSGAVRELHQASGGDWGGTKVDANFIKLLEEIVGADFIRRYQSEFPLQWLELMTTFEKVKKNATPVGRTLRISLPWIMARTYSEFTGSQFDDVITESGRPFGVRFSNGAMILNNDTVKKIFEPVTEQVVKHVRNLLAQPKVSGCKYFFLVGGFGESAFLQEAIKSTFPGVKVLVPTEAQMAVIKGAVLYGHKPSEIKSRISRLTYGCRVQAHFNPQKHDQTKMFINADGMMKCQDLLRVFVEKGEDVYLDEEKTFIFYPSSSTATVASTPLFSIDRKPNDPQYTTDMDVKKIGDGIKIDLPDTTGGMDREIELIVKFGGTEIKVEAKDKTSGNVAKTTVSFISA